MAPRTSLYKFRRAVPEVWFRIVHVTPDHANGLVEYREQTVEVALGPDGAFKNGNVGHLTRRVPFNEVVCAVPECRRRPKHPKPPKEPRTPPAVETLRKAIEWRRQLDSGKVANQAEIARCEGITRARVTQVLGLLRLTPGIRERIRRLLGTTHAALISERALRPMTRQTSEQQVKAFDELVTPRV